MLPAAALHALSEQLIVHADRSPERVTVYGSAVGVSRGLSHRDAITVRAALRVALRRLLEVALASVALDAEVALDPVVDRLVVTEPADEASRYTVRVLGSELVGQEEPAAAESRARSMRAVLVAELQRALAGDEPPATIRRSAPASSVEAR